MSTPVTDRHPHAKTLFVVQAVVNITLVVLAAVAALASFAGADWTESGMGRMYSTGFLLLVVAVFANVSIWWVSRRAERAWNAQHALPEELSEPTQPVPTHA